MDRLAEDLARWDVCRETVRGKTGTYAFSAIQGKQGYWVTMDYWQDYPPNERWERTCIQEKNVPTPYLAVQLLEHWKATERAGGWMGYSLLLESLTNRDVA